MNTLKRIILKYINYILKFMNYELKKISHESSRTSKMALLENLKKLNVSVNTIIDVGAASGTDELYVAYPSKKHILIEPLIEFEKSLQNIAQNYNDMSVHIVGAADQTGEMTFQVLEGLYGSSFLHNTHENSKEVARTIPVTTLDVLCEQEKASAPYLIKLDTQGSELTVLDGASKILKDTEVIIIETSLFQGYENAPIVYDTFTYMEKHDFVLYDIIDLIYRPLDGALSAIDLVFVSRNSRLMADHRFGTPEQMEKLNNKIFHNIPKDVTV